MPHIYEPAQECVKKAAAVTARFFYHDGLSAFVIRAATVADIPSLLALQGQSPTSPRWAAAHYSAALDAHGDGGPNSILMVAVDAQQILGFAVASRVDGEIWELENILVSSATQRQGNGSRLLTELLDAARSVGAVRLQLEVRAGNSAAIRLYERHGFLKDGERKAYYSNPEEDALLFSLFLKNST